MNQIEYLCLGSRREINADHVKYICAGCMQVFDTNNVKCSKCGFDLNRYMSKEYEPEQLRPGTELNDCYYVGKVLGKGGFGITYIGYDKSLGVKVAVKECFPEQMVGRYEGTKEVHLWNESLQERYRENLEGFEKEAKILAQLLEKRVGGLVHVKKRFEENGTAYMVMEYVDGKSLYEYVQEQGGRLSVKEALELLYPIGQLVAQLHQHGLIHRDIKPDNIMIDAQKKTTLIDFGASMEFENAKNNEKIFSPLYSPREQRMGEGQGRSTDIYAYCSVIHHMIVGIWAGPKDLRREDGSLKKPSELGIKMKRGVEKALMHGLEENAAERYQTMEELLYDLYEKSRKRLSCMDAAIACAVIICGIIGIFFAVSAGNPMAGNESAGDAALTKDAADTSESERNNCAAGSGKETQRKEVKLRKNEEGLLELDLSDMYLIDLDFLEQYDLTDVQAVNLSDNELHDIEGLKNMPQLQSLDLGRNYDLKDISIFSELIHLKSISLNNDSAVNDFSSLAGLADLESLDLSGTVIKDLEFVTGLTKLRRLEAEGCFYLTDVSDVQVLKRMEALNIGNCGSDRVWRSLPPMESLKQLSVYHYDFKGRFQFANFPNLEDLNIGRTDTDVKQIACLKNLKSLRISDDLKGIDVLHKIKGMESLYIESDSCITFDQFLIQAADCMTNLRELNIETNNKKREVIDLSRISRFKHLQSIKIIYSNVDIMDLTPLQSLNLKNLELDVRAIRADLNPLLHMLSLKRLILSELKSTAETDLSFLRTLKNLEELELNIGLCCGYEELDSLVKLKSLKLNNMSNVWDADFLSGMDELEELEIIDLGNADLKAAGKLVNLRKLTLLNANILNQNFLNSLNKLEVLNLAVSEPDKKDLEDLDFLQNMPYLRMMDLRNRQIPDITGLAYAKNLTVLDMRYCSGFGGGLEPMGGLESLSCAKLTRAEVKDLAPLAGLKYLSQLNLESCSFYGNMNRSVSGFKNLKNVSVKDSYITSIDWLKDAEKLEKADISTAVIDDLSALSRAKNLRVLIAEDVSGLKNISALRNTRNIRQFVLSGAGTILPVSDLHVLQNNVNMKKLEIKRTEISDLRPIAGWKKLRSLILDENPQLTSADGIGGIKNLRVLSLNDCKNLRDINEIEKLKKLKILNLNHCTALKESELQALAPLIQMKELALDHVNISDLGAVIYGMKKLRVISLRSTDLKDIDVLAQYGRLASVNLDGTGIKNILALKNLPLEELSVVDIELEDLYADLTEFSSDSIWITYSRGMMTKRQVKELKGQHPLWWFIKSD